MDTLVAKKSGKKKLQRAITPKIDGKEFLYTALVLNVIYLCVKCEVGSFYTLEVMARTKIQLKFTKCNNSKNSCNRVMFLVNYTSPQCDLSVYEV